MRNWTRLAWIHAAMAFVTGPGLLAGEVLFQTSFANGAKGWTGRDQALVSDISRRKGTRSLLLRQWRDEEQKSRWLSPAIQGPGRAVKISFWAADNYRRCQDFSYSACVDVLDYDAKGGQIGRSRYLTTIVWDQKRKSDMWGRLLPAGLVWKYHEAIWRPRGRTFRLEFHWPKPIVRGDCYLTDVRVAVATPREVAAASAKLRPTAGRGRLALEISTPVSGNLFYKDVPLRFEVLVYATDGKAVGDLARATLLFDVTDYQKFSIARGRTSFAGATPVADQTFYKSRVGARRKQNLHKHFVIDDPAAREVGREFFLRVRLVGAGGETLAADTVPYGVVNPRRIDKADITRAHFASGYFARHWKLSDRAFRDGPISVKTGVLWDQVYDYYWVRVQPHWPGPMKFGLKRPPLPRITFCPNIEQERVQKTWIRQQVPPEAIIDDPLHPGRITFKIDPYVEYILAYIRRHRRAIARVVPSGLERTIDARTIELHKKAYRAIKKEFPDLPVGLMLYGLGMNPSSDVDLFLRAKLYDYCDFLDTHAYASSVDWSEWERLKSAYRKQKRKVPPLVSTEFAMVGGADQVQRARNMTAGHLDAFAHGMTHLYYFNQCNETRMLPRPFLREPTDLGGSQTSGFLYMQRVDRPKVSELIVPEKPRYRWQVGSWGHEYGGHSLVPTLSAMTYYNLVQNFEAAEYRRTLRPSPNALGYVFDRTDVTVAALWLSNPVGFETFRVRSSAAFVLQDLFGRTVRVQPRHGVALVTVNEEPVTLLFDRRVEDLKIEKVEGGLAPVRVPRGGKGTVRVRIPGVFAGTARATVACTVDGTWPNVPTRLLTLKPGRANSVELPLAIRPLRATGRYPLTARLRIGTAVVGVLKADLRVEELLRLDVEAVPVTVAKPPAIRVVIRSLREKPSRGVVRFDDRFFSPSLTPTVHEKRYEVPARGSAEVFFPVARERVNLSTAYEITMILKDDSGIELTRREEIAFRATPRASGAITIDGDLSDWDLAQLVPVPFARTFTGWGKAHRGPPDCSGVLYTRWDDGRLYFAAVIRDDSPVQRFNDINMWQDDNIMFGLYPWGAKLGEPLKSGYYREHLGLCADGKARIFRVGNVRGGPTTAAGAAIAVRRDGGRYVYEWAYPKKMIFPMQLAPGARFRVSVFPMDRDGPDPGKGKRWPLGGIQLGGFNANVDARPRKWREFLLTR